MKTILSKINENVTESFLLLLISISVLAWSTPPRRDSHNIFILYFVICILFKSLIELSSEGDRCAHDHHVEYALKHGVGLHPSKKGVEC